MVAQAVRLDAPLLVIEEPTAGVDIGPRQLIYTRIRQETGRGRSILIISSDFEEAALIGTRVLVLKDGELVGTLTGGSIDELEIMNLPAFAAVFLGSTAVRPGRVNVWGTVIAVLVLATLVTGLQQIGLAAWVQPFVNGVTLIGAVGVAGLVQRRRPSQTKKTESAHRLAHQRVRSDRRDLPEAGQRTAS